MKGLANSFRTATVIALGLQAGANGQAVRQGTAGSGAPAGADEPVSLGLDTGEGVPSRGLRSGGHMAAYTDDALDVNGGVSDRLVLRVGTSSSKLHLNLFRLRS